MRYSHFSMLPERAFQPRGRYGMTLEGGGGGGPTSSTVTQTNIPDWLRPQTEALLGAATQEYFNVSPEGQITGIKPYKPYSTRGEDYLAGFSPLQQQVQTSAAAMGRPGAFGAGTEMAGAAGAGALETAPRAIDYGQAGYGTGRMGEQLGVRGGEYYGGMGAGYGGAAAGLAGTAEQFGAEGARFGRMGAGMAPEAQQFGRMGAGYGAGAAGLTPEAQMYGRTAADIGQMGLRAEAMGRDVSGEARQYARQAAGMGGTYEQMATDPRITQAYMSPYMQNVLDRQKEAAILDAQKAQLSANLGAGRRPGSLGGSQQALMTAEREKALQAQLGTIQATGLQKAYEDAQRAQQFGVTAGLQGLQGAQSGLGTALQGGQLGLGGIGQAIAGQQAGLQGLGQAGQLYGLGMQGAGMGLQGLGQAGQLYGMGITGAESGLRGLGQAGQLYGQGMQGAGMGLQGVQQQLAGTAQGMQGAQIGLQGISGAQAGYGLAGQQAANLANIANQQQAADIARMQFQAQQGGAQQAQEQAAINQMVQNYAMAQQYPYQQLAGYNALLRGYATPTTTVQQYQAAPSPISQISGLGLTGAAMYGLAKKEGGAIKEKKYAQGGITSIDQKVLNDPTAYPKDVIEKGVANKSISEMIGAIALNQIANAKTQAQQAQAARTPPAQGTVLSQLMGDAGIDQAPTNLPAMAGGGIVAFSGETDGSYVDSELLDYIRKKETGGLPNPDLAVSPKGATGRMQVMPKTAMNPGFGVPSIFQLADASGIEYKGKTEDEAKRLLTNPDLNTSFAQRYVGAMGQKFGNDPVLTAAAYNAGPGAVQRAGGVPNYPETQRYVAGLIPAEKLAGGPKVNPAFVERQEAASEKVRNARREQMGLPPMPAQAAPAQPIPGAAAAIDQVTDITRRGVAEDNQRLFSDILYGRAPVPKRATPNDPRLMAEAAPPGIPPAPKQTTAPTPEAKPEEDSDITALRKSIAARREELGKQKETDKYMALLAAGLGMMGGTSRHALQNIGQGAMQGVAAAQASRKEQREAEQDVLASELGLSRATLYEKMRLDQLQSNKEIAQAKNAIAQQMADLKRIQGYREASAAWDNSPTRTAVEAELKKQYGKNWQQDEKAKIALEIQRKKFLQELMLGGGNEAGILSYAQRMAQ